MAPTSTINAAAAPEQPHNPQPRETIADLMRRCPEQFTRISDVAWSWNSNQKYAANGLETSSHA